MRKQRQGDSGEFDFWVSSTDLMTGLVIVVLSVVMLLSLYVLQIPEYDQPDPDLGDSFQTGEAPATPEPTPTPTPTIHGSLIEGKGDGGDSGGDDGGDGDGGGGGQSAPTPTWLPGIGGDDWHKAAILVTVVDGETGRAIREQGVTFELYEEQAGQKGVLRYLYNYYPEKNEYRNFATTQDGIFYLPEKIEEGRYYFHQISEVTGYDSAEAVSFEVDSTYDWAEPFMVSVAIYPTKNVIRLRMLDADTNEPVEAGTFRVEAAESIFTKDNSLRFAAGQEADSITLDENGMGVSSELYLGEYTVVQDEIPRYYASLDEGSMPVSVGGRREGTLPEIRLASRKTQIRVQVKDEFTDEPLAGAAFTLSCDHYPELTQTAVTDSKGQLMFTDLEKNRAYKLTQTATLEDYHYLREPISFIVDSNGRIADEAVAEAKLTNFVPRLSVSVQDKLFGRAISGESLALYDENDALIRQWVSTGGQEVFQDLPMGSYYVLVNDDAERPWRFEFDGGAAMKTVSIVLFTINNTLTLAGGAAALLAVGGGALALALRRRRRKAKGE